MDTQRASPDYDLIGWDKHPDFEKMVAAVRAEIRSRASYRLALAWVMMKCGKPTRHVRNARLLRGNGSPSLAWLNRLFTGDFGATVSDETMLCAIIDSGYPVEVFGATTARIGMRKLALREIEQQIEWRRQHRRTRTCDPVFNEFTR